MDRQFLELLVCAKTTEAEFNEFLAAKLPSELATDHGGITVLLEPKPYDKQLIISQWQILKARHDESSGAFPAQKVIDELCERFDCKWGKWYH